MVVLSRCPPASTMPDSAASTAAKLCPPRPAPNSRAMAATSSTAPPASSADGVRSTTRLPGAIVSSSRASAGTRGPWST